MTGCVTSDTLSPVPDELLTINEVAGMMKVSPRTVRRWVEAGELRVIRLPGRTIRFRLDDVQALAS